MWTVVLLWILFGAILVPSLCAEKLPLARFIMEIGRRDENV